MRGGFHVGPGWVVLLTDLGVDPSVVLREASLPADLFTSRRSLDTATYFRLWEAIESVAGDPALPLRMAEVVSAEAFDPAIFAAMCSRDLNTALARIARYKKLICPMELTVVVGPKETRLEVRWLDRSRSPSGLMVAAELVFFVSLARMGTRQEVRPVAVGSPFPLRPARDYEEWFGVSPVESEVPFVCFASRDGSRPFVTANEAVWESLEPELGRRLALLEGRNATRDRAKAVLVETLPAGESSLAGVADRLAMSPRTLQRRLGEEGVAFRDLVSEIRRSLADHYLETSDLSSAEIAFLLGYEEPTSFYRAYRGWTGRTPEASRKSAGHGPRPRRLGITARGGTA